MDLKGTHKLINAIMYSPNDEYKRRCFEEVMETIKEQKLAEKRHELKQNKFRLDESVRIVTAYKEIIVKVEFDTPQQAQNVFKALNTASFYRAKYRFLVRVSTFVTRNLEFYTWGYDNEDQAKKAIATVLRRNGTPLTESAVVTTEEIDSDELEQIERQQAKIDQEKERLDRMKDDAREPDPGEEREDDEDLEEEGRCWKGYKPVKGKKPYSDGSCEKVDEEDEAPLEEAYGLHSQNQFINPTDGTFIDIPHKYSHTQHIIWDTLENGSKIYGVTKLELMRAKKIDPNKYMTVATDYIPEVIYLATRKGWVRSAMMRSKSDLFFQGNTYQRIAKALEIWVDRIKTTNRPNDIYIEQIGSSGKPMRNDTLTYGSKAMKHFIEKGGSIPRDIANFMEAKSNSAERVYAFKDKNTAQDFADALDTLDLASSKVKGKMVYVDTKKAKDKDLMTIHQIATHENGSLQERWMDLTKLLPEDDVKIVQALHEAICEESDDTSMFFERFETVDNLDTIVEFARQEMTDAEK